jgi:hypothetical protein
MEEWPYNRHNYVINRTKWIEHYIKLCNHEIRNRKGSFFRKMNKKWI